ncbi:MAG: ribonuclease PH [Verrucomicrobiae bacterium]|nr:ribonuclease PH [Verrucomicrobiae bacterium]
MSTSSVRSDKRQPDEMRRVRIRKNYVRTAAGSALCEFGRTRVICAVTVEEEVPRWMKEQKVSGGWITSEYQMLPYSTALRKPRESTRGRVDGRTMEIQRLVGRAMRAVIDLEKIGPRTIWIDCDVLEADGGTRTAAITGSFVALALALRKLQQQKLVVEWPIKQQVAAVSVGIVGGVPLLDLNYEEDARASVDMNVVMTDGGEYVEVQGTGEEQTFSKTQLDQMLQLAGKGIRELIALQRRTLGLK